MSIKFSSVIRVVNIFYIAARTPAEYLVKQNHQVLVTVSLVLLLLLSACGGGGGSNPVTDPQPENPAPVNPPPANDPISFENPGPDGVATSINGDLETAANQNIPVIEFNDAGVGISVWQVELSTGMKVLYSLYDPLSRTWSDETILYYGSYLDDRSNISLLKDIQLATNGTGFVITWSDSREVYVKQYEPAAIPQWSDVINLSTSVDSRISSSPKISSNGAEYVVTWVRNRQVVASMSSGMGWSAVPVIIGDVVQSATLTGFSFGGLETISDGQGFLISWIVTESEFDQGVNISHAYTSIYTSPGGWGSIVEINETNLDSAVRALKLAANTNGYLVTWWTQLDLQGPFIGKANVYHVNAIGGPQWLGENAVTGQVVSVQDFSPVASKTGFVIVWRNWVNQLVNVAANTFSFSGLVGWQGPIQISPVAGNTFARLFDVASNGAGYMVVWLDRINNASRAYNLSAREFDGVLWDTEPAVLATTDNALIKSPVIHSNGTDYTAMWKQEVVGQLNTQDIYAKHFMPGMGWSSAEVVEAGVVEPEFPVSNIDQISISSAGSLYFAYWIDISGDKANNPTVKMFDVSWSESQKLSKGKHLESSNLPTIISNGDGQLLSIWLHSVDSFTRVFASIRSGGLWSNPVRIDQDEKRFLNRAGWSSGQESRFYNVAANGSTFMVVWDHRDNLYSRVFDGQGWSTEPVQVNDKDLGGSGPSIVPFGDGYIVAWSQYDTTNNKIIVYSAIYNNGVWTQQVVADINLQDVFANTTVFNPRVISNNKGDYIVVWSTKNLGGVYQIYSRTNVDGQWLNQGTLVHDTASQNLTAIQSVANSSGKFMLAWYQQSSLTQDSGIYVSTTNTVDYAWSSARLLQQSGSVQNPELVSGGENFAIIWRKFDSVVASINENDNWTPNTLLSFGSGSQLNGSVSLSSNGNGYAVVWQEQGSTGKTGTYISRNDGAGWSNALPISALTEQQQAYNPSICVYNNNYAVAWVQSDSSVDPVFTNAWAKAGGF